MFRQKACQILTILQWQMGEEKAPNGVIARRKMASSRGVAYRNLESQGGRHPGRSIFRGTSLVTEDSFR